MDNVLLAPSALGCRPRAQSTLLLLNAHVMFARSAIIVTKMYAVYFSAWVIASFLAHKLAKSYFQSVSRLYHEDTTVLAMLVTGCQLLCCGILAIIKIPIANSQPQKESPSLQVLLMAAIPHMFGALMTNYSMALIPAASTHFIKVMEPMFTAILAWLIVGVEFSRPKLFSMVIVIIGGVGASWNPNSSDLTGFSLGLKLALISNLFYAARNVTIKHLFN